MSRRTGKPSGRPPGGADIDRMWVEACIWAKKYREEKQRAADAMLGRQRPKPEAA